MRPVRASIVLALGLAIVLASTGRTSSPSGGAAPSREPGAAVSGSITVAAAASLTDPFKAIGAAFERANPGTTVTFTFDSSARLASQIEAGAPVDVFASADVPTMNELNDAGLVASTPTTFASNKLVIVVKRGNPAGVQSLADLRTVDVGSLCGADVPCGRYADDILQRAGVSIPAEHASRAQNAKAAFAAVAEGDAEAGIVYATDVTGERVSTVAIPDDQNARVVYPLAVLKAASDRSLADRFVAFVLAADGRSALTAVGFGPP
jgi:molybdate transport system substrate-binding protein